MRILRGKVGIMNSVGGAAAAAPVDPGDTLLMETGDDLLLENGDFILLE